MARIEVSYQSGQKASREHCRALESGDILYFPNIPFDFPVADQRFLVTQRQVDGQHHKNISYRPAQDRLTGIDQRDPAERQRVHAVLQSFSRESVAFLAGMFPQYAAAWKIDYASFRPIEEAGRNVSQRSRNDLIHVDNFPSRPSHGDRLLRLFVNIHPQRPRIWVTSDPFETLARRYGKQVGLPKEPRTVDRLRGRALETLAKVGVPVVNRPPYDQFMLRFHHFLKENAEFQANCRKERWEFPPGSCWIVFTDTTSHSCISGQYALEQTFIVRHRSLTAPERAPISILEELAGFPLHGSRAKAA